MTVMWGIAALVELAAIAWLARENSRLDAALDETRRKLRDLTPKDYHFSMVETQQRSKDRWR